VPAQVLVVATDPAEEAAAPWAALLHAAGYGVRTVTSLPQARALLTTQPVEGVLLDAPLPDRTVLPFCAELRQLCGAQVVLIVVCPPEAAHLRVAALELGADDVVPPTVATAEVRARLAAHLRRRASRG
jgi:DNA-binding response OmpR family regulator